MKKLSNIEKAILRPLLESFERKSGNRRVILAAEKFPEYDLNMLEKKKLFITGLDLLVGRDLIVYEWVKFEEGNLVKRVILKEEHVILAYELLGEMTQNQREQIYLSELDGYQKMVRNSWVKKFLDDEYKFISDYKKWSRLWPKTEGERQEFMKLLHSIQDEPDVSLRYLSSKLYGDSKRLEKNYRSKLISVARKYVPLELENDEILNYLGLEMNPSEILFCGDMKYRLKNHVIDAGIHIYGTSVNKETVIAMEILEVGSKKVLTIENKATYYEYIKIKREDELVIYLGGFFGKTSRLFLEKLEIAQIKEFYHWSDIDLGGFRIFRYLSNVLKVQVIPKMMNPKIYRQYKNSMHDPLSDANLMEIKSMLSDPVMAPLKATMEAVLDVGMRLEQEMIDLANN
ncbi:MAG: DUF2220 domain-containing protein [Vallitaleaceae bacterium]|nr:DUF2220 domain-containing protein [Vallitaleaceae bacterium]